MALRRTEQTLEGTQRFHYESGIEFTSVDRAQKAALADILEKLQATSASPDRMPSS
jgi:hypothetical protein